MALKLTLEQWDQATQAYDQQDYNAALDLFESIADSAKIHFNIGVILAAAGDHESAVKSYVSALFLDPYFALAYFQKGVSNAKLGEWESAFDDFNDALLYLRGNLFIDYKQLGMDYKLYSCEVLFNRGLCYMQLHEDDLGFKDFETARKEKQLPDHERVELALSQGWEQQPIFKLPRGKIFRPDESKLKNSKKVDYLGKAKLIASQDVQDTNTGFKGSADRRAASEKTTSPIPKSNAVQPSHNAPLLPADGRRQYGLGRNNTHIGNFPVRRMGSDDPLHANAVQRRPTVDGAPIRSRAATTSSQNAPPMAQLAGMRSSVRRNTDAHATLPILAPVAVHANGSDLTSKRDDISTGHDAKLSRSNSRAKALALARQNSMDRRQNQSRSGSAPHSRDRSPARSPARTPEPVGMRRSNSSRDGHEAPPMPSMRTQPPLPPPQRHENGRDPRGNPNSNYPYGSNSQPPSSNNSSGDSGPWYGSSVIPPGKTKLKCHYGDDTRYLMIDSGVDFAELRMRVTDKFNGRRLMQLKYRDEDNELVVVSDNEDLDIARGNFDHRGATTQRLELWCSD